MALIIEWHPQAVDDLKNIGRPDQQRIRRALEDFAALDDARQRLVAYSGALKGFWKLRVGSYRLVCSLEDRAGRHVLIIHLAHRSVVYGRRGLRAISNRSDQ